MASIAVLPVLIGLAVDYAIQFQARFDEAATARGDARSPRPAAAAAAGPRSSPRGWPPRSASSCCCCRRSRWCAASARCSCSASGSRWCARSAPASPRWFASAARRARAAEGAPAPAAARALAALGRHHASAGRPREWLADRAWRALGPGALAAARGCWPIGLAVAVVGLAAGHPERGRVRRARARAPGPPGAEGRERAPGGDRRLGRDRRDRARRRHHRPGRGELDDALPGGRAARPRLPPGQALHAGAQPARAVPGAVAARPVPQLDGAAQAQVRQPARRRAAVLLAGRGHAPTARPPTSPSASG